MTGLMKSCNVYSNRKTVEQYISNLNPYENRPSIGIDLLALTRYARANNKKPEDMGETEVAAFMHNKEGEIER